MARGVKGSGEPAKVRIGYLIYTVDDGNLNVIATVRSAEDALRLVDENANAKYHRFSMN